MIAFVYGELSDIETNSVVVDCAGVGYRVFTPINPRLLSVGVGSDIKLYTYLSIREDAMDLYGFMDKESLEMFKKLISVSGVGPRIALQILTNMDTTRLTMAILSEDKKTLTGVPGVGPKMAARITLDLKDKVSMSGLSGGADQASPAASLTAASAEGPAREAVQALEALGYTRQEAENAVGKVEGSDQLTVEEIIRRSLSQLY